MAPYQRIHQDPAKPPVRADVTTLISTTCGRTHVYIPALASWLASMDFSEVTLEALHVVASLDRRRSVRPRFGRRLRRDLGAALRGGPQDPRALLLDISGGCAAFYGATPRLFSVVCVGISHRVALLRGVGPGAPWHLRASLRSELVAPAGPLARAPRRQNRKAGFSLFEAQIPPALIASSIDGPPEMVARSGSWPHRNGMTAAFGESSLMRLPVFSSMRA